MNIQIKSLYVLKIKSKSHIFKSFTIFCPVGTDQLPRPVAAEGWRQKGGQEEGEGYSLKGRGYSLGWEEGRYGGGKGGGIRGCRLNVVAFCLVWHLN